MKLSKTQRLKAYRYAFKDIKDSDANFFICWRIESYLINEDVDTKGISYSEMVKMLPELYKRAPLAYKKRNRYSFFDANEQEKRLELLRKCINDLK